MKQLPDETGTLRRAVDVPVKLRSTFGTESLFIRAPLAGSTHRFTFTQHRIEIHLPDPLPSKAVGDPERERPPVCGAIAGGPKPRHRLIMRFGACEWSWT